MVSSGNPLALSLLLVAEWFDRSLRARLQRDGWPRLSRNQSRFIAEVDGRRTQSEIARRLGITRQSTHVIAAQLREHGILAPPGAAVRLSVRGEQLAQQARKHLVELEQEMQAGWNGGSVTGLRDQLEAWLATSDAGD